MNRTLLAFLAFFIGVTPGSYRTIHAAEFPVLALESTVSVLPHRSSGNNSSSENSGHLEEPEGSGIAIFNGSYIATAAHVLSGAEKMSVRLHDGRIIPAVMVGQDRFTDIALLKITYPLASFTLAESPGIGEPVCAIGNQFGLGLSVTCGVVSALHRSNAGFNPIEDFIQTDAVVNPGASGGALVNKQGHLVGMLSGIFTKDSDANIGVNFAVHTGLLERVLLDLKDHGRVVRAKSGMVVRPLELSELEVQTGVRVVRVASESAADIAGLLPDDVIVTMNERKILYPSDVSAIIYEHKAGDVIPIEIIRGEIKKSILLKL